jgi:hypothetical protein
MALADIIRGIPNWTTKTAAELRADLLADVVGSDSQLYTYAGVIDKIGITAGFGFRATIRGLADLSNPGGLPQDAFEAINFAHERFAGGGLDLSRDDVQALLDSFVAITPLAPFIPAIKAIGKPVQTYYASQGGVDSVPSELAISLARDKAAKEDAAVDRLQAYREALASWDGVSQEPVL